MLRALIYEIFLKTYYGFHNFLYFYESNIKNFFLNIPLVNTLKVPIQCFPVYILRHVEGEKLECVLMQLEFFFLRRIL